MEKLEKLEIPTIEFSKVTMLANGGTSGCDGGEQTEQTAGSNGGYETGFQGD